MYSCSLSNIHFLVFTSLLVQTNCLLQQVTQANAILRQDKLHLSTDLAALQSTLLQTREQLQLQTADSQQKQQELVSLQQQLAVSLHDVQEKQQQLAERQRQIDAKDAFIREQEREIIAGEATIEQQDGLLSHAQWVADENVRQLNQLQHVMTTTNQENAEARVNLQQLQRQVAARDAIILQKQQQFELIERVAADIQRQLQTQLSAAMQQFYGDRLQAQLAQFGDSELTTLQQLLQQLREITSTEWRPTAPGDSVQAIISTVAEDVQPGEFCCFRDLIACGRT